MKKKVLCISIVIFLIGYFCYSQNKATEFEKKMLNLSIKQKANVSDEDFEKGRNKFYNAISQVKNDSMQFTYVDYWNLTVAQLYLKAPDKDITFSFKKAYKLNPKNTCVILNSFLINSKEKYNKLIEITPNASTIINNCSNTLNSTEKKEVENKNHYTDDFLKEYSTKYKLDFNLVRLMANIAEDDQKYRDSNFTENSLKQRKIDLQNQKKIDSLYKRYNIYIGKSMVGDKFKVIMWLVIQHSNIDMMKKYLPILFDAYKQNNAPVGIIKMLIDRIYAIEKKVQIFGSQKGIKLANEKIRSEVKKEYGFK